MLDLLLSVLHETGECATKNALRGMLTGLEMCLQSDVNKSCTEVGAQKYCF